MKTYMEHSGKREESFSNAVRANATVADFALVSFKMDSTTSTASDSVTCNNLVSSAVNTLKNHT